MWTKQLTAEGKPFYYNSSLNKSLWTPPPDAIVHEAENLIPLHAPEQGEISEIVEAIQNVPTVPVLQAPALPANITNPPFMIQSVDAR